MGEDVRPRGPATSGAGSRQGHGVSTAESPLPGQDRAVRSAAGVLIGADVPPGRADAAPGGE